MTNSPSPTAVRTKIPHLATTSMDSAAVFAFNGPAAIAAAVLATAAITLDMLFIPRLLGIEEMDIGITVGRISDPDGGILAFVMRVLWHVGNGLVYVFCYAAVLLYLRRQSSLLTGVVFGIILWTAGPMLLIPLLLNLHPAVASGQLTNPGVFMLDLGFGWKPAAIDLGAHLLHGIITGVVYTHRVIRRPA